ncbi:MAG: SLC13 family permease [Clostridia bacterium]|nr:SLC13 family permease [Clostridia bacterium]
MTELVVFLLAIGLTVWISSKTKINMGIIALFFAFLIGIVFLGKSPASIFKSNFPTSVVATIIPAYIFFGAVGQTGATLALARRVGKKMHSNQRVVAVIMIYLVSIALTVGTAGGEGIRYAMLAFSISLCLQLKIDPAVGVFACWAGWQGSTCLPFSSLGSIVTGIVSNSYPEINTVNVILLNLGLGLAFFTIMLGIQYLVNGRKPYTAEIEEGAMPIDTNAEDKPFTKEQRLATIVLFTVVAVLLIPSVIQLFAPNPVTKFMASRFDVSFCFIVGSLILFLTKSADCVRVIKQDINWSIIVLLAGMCTLLGEASGLGIIDTLNAGIAKVPSFLVVPIVAVVCGFLSMFVNGATLTPMFVPLALGLSQTAGVSLPFMLFVMISGFAVTGISPASGGGAGNLTVVPGEKMQGHVAKVEATTAIFQMFAFAVFCGVLQLFF